MPPAEVPHVPVMPEQVVSLVAAEPGAVIVDGTFGAGGHARLISTSLAGSGCYIAVDRDETARPRFDLFAEEVAPLESRFVHAAFPDAFDALHGEGVSADAVILDIGVSSMQLDQVERGFSYANDAPLDMRMDQSSGEPASALLARADASELARILREYGEERHAGRIARAIVRRREAGEPLERSAQLVDTIMAALPPAVRFAPGGHPARRSFQALRIAVNDELGMLDRGLDSALELLKPNGRLVVMSFHSLEDRIVKRRFEAWAGRCTCPPGFPVCACGAVARAETLTRGVARPDEAEQATNPRAASTRLRAIRRIEPPRPIAGARS